MLRSVGPKLRIIADPLSHFVLGVLRIPELGWLGPCVNVRQCDYQICRASSIREKILDEPFQLFTRGYASGLRHRIETRHPIFQVLLEVCSQMREKCLFRFSLDNDGNSHDRPPMRPICHTSSSV